MVRDGQKILVSQTMTVIDQKTTASRARRLRLQSKVSLREVAKRMKISPAYLSDLERGNRNWSDALCQVFVSAVLKN
jgi:cytoskeletal protein RodZ